VEEDFAGGLHIGGCIITQAPLSIRRSSQRSTPTAGCGTTGYTSPSPSQRREVQQTEECTAERQQQLQLLHELQRQDDSDASLDEELQDYLSNIQQVSKRRLPRDS
jgi:hypothetical protein